MEPNPLRAFETQALAIEQVVAVLTEPDFARATNCPPWTVRDLIGHFCQRIGTGALPDAAPWATPTLYEAADYDRLLVRQTVEYHDLIARTASSALAVTRPVFVSLLGSDPPEELEWDDRTFFAVATGRRQLAEHEKALVSDETFPLLS